MEKKNCPSPNKKKSFYPKALYHKFFFFFKISKKRKAPALLGNSPAGEKNPKNKKKFSPPAPFLG